MCASHLLSAAKVRSCPLNAPLSNGWPNMAIDSPSLEDSFADLRIDVPVKAPAATKGEFLASIRVRDVFMISVVVFSIVHYFR